VNIVRQTNPHFFTNNNDNKDEDKLLSYLSSKRRIDETERGTRTPAQILCLFNSRHRSSEDAATIGISQGALQRARGRRVSCPRRYPHQYIVVIDRNAVVTILYGSHRHASRPSLWLNNSIDFVNHSKNSRCSRMHPIIRLG
jgi:hypothetical protein